MVANFTVVYIQSFSVSPYNIYVDIFIKHGYIESIPHREN